ncbi:MAG: alpha/beta hydrolase [Leptospiraceae bacterium]|nr:alpha/beta hydrolase [Leptospiraceae bacterium]
MVELTKTSIFIQLRNKPTDRMPYQAQNKSYIHILIIIPGNPGIAEYYKPLENILDQLTKNQFKIHTLNYKGFQDSEQDRLFNLKEELAFKIEQIDNLIQSYRKINPILKLTDFKISLLGHSIGAWIAHEILKQKPYLEIDKVIYIFPFIHKDKSSMIQNLLGLLLRLPFLNKCLLFLYQMIRSLPDFLLKIVLNSKLKAMNDQGRHVTWKYFIEFKHILKSIFFLAKTEFQILPNQLQIDSFEYRLKDRYFLYNTDDMWAPVSSLNQLKLKYKDLNYSLYHGSLHDFCVTDEGNQWVSKEIIKILTLK